MSGPGPRRVGHKGADLIVPGNTRASFDAALAAGVDMIEFDVLPELGSDRLILAHDPHEAARRDPETLEQGLAHLAADPFADVELDVDLKIPGYELRVVEALRAFGLIERTLVSSQYRSSLALDPRRGAGAAARLVGPAAATRSVALARARRSRLQLHARVAGGAPVPRGRRDPGAARWTR